MTLRLVLVVALLAAWTAGITARLYYLQVVRHDEYKSQALRQQRVRLELTPPRGTIYDARGRELAVSMTVDSAVVDPSRVEDLDGLLSRLALVPEVDLEAAARNLDRDRRFAWIARQLDPGPAARLRALEIPELRFVSESKRYYPAHESAAAVLGFVGVDAEGLGGLESRYERELSGAPVLRPVLRDARARIAQIPGLSFRSAEPGLDLHLTLDASIQHIAERELRRAVERHEAAGGSVLILDPWSGAVLAMASVPGFDPNRFAAAPPERWRNRLVSDAFEPGSTFKLVTAAAALEGGRFDPSDLIDCEQGSITLEGVRIRDHKPFGELTVREVIARSSNVGAIKLGLRAGSRSLHRWILAFGFGSPTGIDLPGESAGIVHPVERWGRRASAYISFGQGVSVTPLQLALAYGAVANGGLLYRPYLVAALGREGGIERRPRRPRPLGRALEPATARTLERLLEAVVAEGSGREAGIPGYRVAGKTGTAQVPVPGGYSATRFIASFVGFAPARKPALVGLVKIDEPRPEWGFHGGEVAAPVFASIVSQVLVYLGVAPERGALERWPGEPPSTVLEADAAAAPSPRPRLAGLEEKAAPAGARVSLTAPTGADSAGGG